MIKIQQSTSGSWISALPSTSSCWQRTILGSQHRSYLNTLQLTAIKLRPIITFISGSQVLTVACVRASQSLGQQPLSSCQASDWYPKYRLRTLMCQPVVQLPEHRAVWLHLLPTIGHAPAYRWRWWLIEECNMKFIFSHQCMLCESWMEVFQWNTSNGMPLYLARGQSHLCTRYSALSLSLQNCERASAQLCPLFYISSASSVRIRQYCSIVSLVWSLSNERTEHFCNPKSHDSSCKLCRSEDT